MKDPNPTDKPYEIRMTLHVRSKDQESAWAFAEYIKAHQILEPDYGGNHVGKVDVDAVSPKEEPHERLIVCPACGSNLYLDRDIIGHTSYTVDPVTGKMMEQGFQSDEETHDYRLFCGGGCDLSIVAFDVDPYEMSLSLITPPKGRDKGQELRDLIDYFKKQPK